jgi:hypothetical protein
MEQHPVAGAFLACQDLLDVLLAQNALGQALLILRELDLRRRVLRDMVGALTKPE